MDVDKQRYWELSLCRIPPLWAILLLTLQVLPGSAERSLNLVFSKDAWIPGCLVENLSDRKQKLGVGRSLIIKGKPGTWRFAINIHNENNDMALHFNPRMDIGWIILTTQFNGIYTTGEIHWRNTDFKPGVPFNLEMKMEKNAVIINVNGRYYGDFKLQSDVRELDYFSICKDVEISSAVMR